MAKNLVAALWLLFNAKYAVAKYNPANGPQAVSLRLLCYIIATVCTSVLTRVIDLKCPMLSPEKDVNGDTLWVWCYPAVSSEFRQVLLSKCCLTQNNKDFHTFVFGQFCRSWYYISTLEVQEPTPLKKVLCSFITTKAQLLFLNT